jgi:hypothetical protein
MVTIKDQGVYTIHIFMHVHCAPDEMIYVYVDSGFSQRMHEKIND